MNKSKGSDFERAICKQLSLWWSEGSRDDIFWRTSMSGGRATVRRKSGKDTAMQCGDISATDPVGVPLISCLTIELKRGYGRACPFDLLDSNPSKTLEWPLFLKQAKAAQEAGKTPWWSVIFQRDRRQVCIVIPFEMWSRRCRAGDNDMEIDRILIRAAGENMIVMKLSSFLERFQPGWFRAVYDFSE